MENIKITTVHVVTGILVPLIFHNVQCTLITKPKDAAAKMGEIVNMTCSSSYVADTCGGIAWKYFKPNSSYGTYIYNNAELSSSVTSYISLIDSSAGNCDLRINATASGAGRYECFDGDTDASAVLIVLENVPEVKVINQSSHGNSRALACSVNYYGILAAKAQWVKIVGDIWTNVTEIESKIKENPDLSLIQFSSIIHIPTDATTEHYICNVKISTFAWKSLGCGAAWNKTTEVEESVPALLAKAYNDGLGYGIGIGFVIGFFICLCLCGIIIFLILCHFNIFPPKGDAKETKGENQPALALKPTE